MPQGLQTVAFFKTLCAGTTAEALAPVTGDSATFFNVPQGSVAYLAEIWAVDNLHAAEVTLTASRFHDQVFGIRGEVTSGAATAPTLRPVPISPIGLDQPIFPSDVLSVQTICTANDDVNVTLLIYYENIPGIDARLATYNYVKSNMKNLVGINVSITPGDGNYGSTVALNATDNRLHANTDYAVLGFTAPLALASCVIKGIDTGNLRVGGPVLGDPAHDAYMFVDYANAYDAALIPIINSNNAGSITLEAAGTDQSATSVDVMLAELKNPFGG